MKTIKVLGTGCAKCNRLYDEVKKAVADSGIDATVEKVEDLPSIMAYGVAFTPALVIDDKVHSAGKVLRAAQIIELLEG
jgi:small redox-active disulfide protein 2